MSIAKHSFQIISTISVIFLSFGYSSDSVLAFDDDIYTFTKAAISENNWQYKYKTDDAPISYKYIGSTNYQKNIYEKMPLLAEYIFRDNGTPATNVINKWQKDSKINIGMGWPDFIQPYEHQSIQMSHEQKKAFGNVIINNINNFNTISGLQLSFISQETPHNYGRVRILPLSDHQFERLLTKKGHIFTFNTRPSFEVFFEPAFVSAVPFFIPADKEVDLFGYLLPSVKNEIEWSVCYIRKGNYEQDFMAVHNCLMRSLGLPDYDPNIMQSNHNDNSKQSLKELSSKDKQLLETLYSGQIAAGDGYWQVYNKFKTTKD